MKVVLGWCSVVDLNITLKDIEVVVLKNVGIDGNCGRIDFWV